MAKKTYKIHLGAYFCGDIEVSADNIEEAIEIAQENVELDFADWMGKPDVTEVTDND